MASFDSRALVSFAYDRIGTLFYRDYTAHFAPQDFAPSVFADGVLKHSDRGLRIESLAFGRERAQAEDKMLNLYLPKFSLEGEEMLFETVMSAFQIFPSKVATPNEEYVPQEYIARIDNAYADYRLCCSSFLVKDAEGVLTFGFLLTSDLIYAYYARHAKLPGETFFSSVVPVKRRGYGPAASQDPMDDTYRLAIKINEALAKVEWLIGGERVLFHDRLGYRLLQGTVLEGGGDDTLVKLTAVTLGFGHHTFLDHQGLSGPCRLDMSSSAGTSKIRRSATGLAPRAGIRYREIHPDTFGRFRSVIPEISFAVPKPDPGHYSWGQGVISLVRSVCVSSIYRDIVPYVGHDPDGLPVLPQQLGTSTNSQIPYETSQPISAGQSTDGLETLPPFPI